MTSCARSRVWSFHLAPADVRVRRRRTDDEVLGDLTVAQARGDEPHHLALTRRRLRQLLGAGQPRIGLRVEVGEQEATDAPREHGSPAATARTDRTSAADWPGGGLGGGLMLEAAIEDHDVSRHAHRWLPLSASANAPASPVGSRLTTSASRDLSSSISRLCARSEAVLASASRSVCRTRVLIRSSSRSDSRARGFEVRPRPIERSPGPPRERACPSRVRGSGARSPEGSRSYERLSSPPPSRKDAGRGDRPCVHQDRKPESCGWLTPASRSSGLGGAPREP